MGNLQNNMMIEVEQFIGEQLEDYTNEQVVNQVEKKFGQWWVTFATQKIADYITKYGESN